MLTPGMLKSSISFLKPFIKRAREGAGDVSIEGARYILDIPLAELVRYFVRLIFSVSRILIAA